jgi:hypothetical protein
MLIPLPEPLEVFHRFSTDPAVLSERVLIFGLFPNRMGMTACIKPGGRSKKDEVLCLCKAGGG